MAKTPEGAVLKAVMELLAAEHILAFRMQTGATVSSYGGRTRMIRYGTPGMADVLAFPKNDRIVWANYDHSKETYALWLECKAGNGKQSELQKSFQDQVEAQGHRYAVVRSIADVLGILGRKA